VIIDPSQNIFYAENGDPAGYNHSKIVMSNNPKYVQLQDNIKEPKTKDEKTNRVIKKRRLQALQFAGSCDSSKLSNFTFE